MDLIRPIKNKDWQPQNQNFGQVCQSSRIHSELPCVWFKQKSCLTPKDLKTIQQFSQIVGTSVAKSWLFFPACGAEGLRRARPGVARSRGLARWLMEKGNPGTLRIRFDAGSSTEILVTWKTSWLNGEVKGETILTVNDPQNPEIVLIITGTVVP